MQQEEPVERAIHHRITTLRTEASQLAAEVDQAATVAAAVPAVAMVVEEEEEQEEEE